MLNSPFLDGRFIEELVRDSQRLRAQTVLLRRRGQRSRRDADGLVSRVSDVRRRSRLSLYQRREIAGGGYHDPLLAWHNETLPQGTVLWFKGEIDSTTVGLLNEHLERGLQRGTHVIVDLSAVRYIDSSGYHALVRARDARKAVGQRLVIVGLNPLLKKTFKILGLHRIMDITTSVETAKRWLEIY